MTRVTTPQGIFNYRRGHVDRKQFAESGDENGVMGSDGAVGGSVDVLPEVTEESIRELVGSGGDPVPYDQFIAATSKAYIDGYNDGRAAALADVKKWVEDTYGHR